MKSTNEQVIYSYIAALSKHENKSVTFVTMESYAFTSVMHNFLKRVNKIKTQKIVYMD